MRSILLLPVLLASILLTLSSSAEAKKPQQVLTLTEENWGKINKGEWMIEFFAPWCPACRALHPAWAEFSEWTEDLGLDGVAQVDVTENPGLSGRFMVTALPTIFHVKDGEFRQYRGPRDKDSFISFVEDRKYAEVETIPSWKHPNSMQMSLVSYFFKMSMMLRNVHQIVTEDYGYPYWVSYVLFAVGTIVFGALLGLVLVCCVDCFFPYSKHQHHTSAGPITVSQKKKKKEDEEEEDDEKDSEDEDGGGDASQDEQSQEEDEEEEEEEREKEETSAVRKRRAKKAD